MDPRCVAGSDVASHEASTRMPERADGRGINTARSPDTQSSTRTMDLESLLPELFEHLTDYLHIKDVRNPQLTSKRVSAYTRTDWAGFLRRRLVRHSGRNTRVLSFLVLLNSLFEHYLDKGSATDKEVSSAVSRLEEGLAVDSGWGLSDRIQSLKRAETLQVMCYYMETIDHLTDDFASQLVCPISTRQKVLVAESDEARIWPGECPRWPTHESPIVLSTAERARFREAFLAYQVLCLLSKKDFHPDPSLSVPQQLYPFSGRFSPLEIERISSIFDYFFYTWVWILIDGFERTNWCETRGSLTRGSFLDHEYDDAFSWHTTFLAGQCASGGIATLWRELDPSRPSWTEFDYDKNTWKDICNNLQGKCQPDFDAPAPPRPKYTRYGNLGYIFNTLDVVYRPLDDSDTLYQARLSPGEEERQDRQITPLWLPFKKEVKTRRINTWLGSSSSDQIFRMIKPDDPSLSRDGLFNCRARGWVFLDPDTFETI